MVDDKEVELFKMVFEAVKEYASKEDCRQFCDEDFSCDVYRIFGKVMCEPKYIIVNGDKDE